MNFHWPFGRRHEPVRVVVAVASESAKARAKRKALEAKLHAMVDPLPAETKAAAIRRAAVRQVML